MSATRPTSPPTSLRSNMSTPTKSHRELTEKSDKGHRTVDTTPLDRGRTAWLTIAGASVLHLSQRSYMTLMYSRHKLDGPILYLWVSPPPLSVRPAPSHPLLASYINAFGVYQGTLTNPSINRTTNPCAPPHHSFRLLRARISLSRVSIQRQVSTTSIDRTVHSLDGVGRLLSCCTLTVSLAAGSEVSSCF